MNFDPEQWNCHKKGQDARSLILENLPTDVETLCKTVGRSQSQVKRHIQTLRAEGKVKRQGALIVAACTAFILLLPTIGHCVETDCLENNENIFLDSPLQAVQITKFLGDTLKMETLTANSKADLVEALGTRYGRGKSSLYEWLGKLEISTPKQDGMYIISSDDLAKLDNLNQWISEGNRLIDYPEIKNKSAIATVENQAIEEASVPLQTEGVSDEFTQLIRAAQEKGAGLAIAQNLALSDEQMIRYTKHGHRLRISKRRDTMTKIEKMIQKAEND